MADAMEISYIGHASFKLKGKTATVVTDPFDPEMVGLKFSQPEANIVTISHAHADHNRADLVAGQPVIISGPGEYEVKGVAIKGIASFHDAQKGQDRGKNTIYAMVIDSVHVVHLGDLGHKLSEEQVDEIGVVDILLVPVGGVYTIDAKEAYAIVTQLEPHIVIPMHYKRAGLASGLETLLPVETFLKEIGKEGVLPQPKLVISKDKLPEELSVVVLE